MRRLSIAAFVFVLAISASHAQDAAKSANPGDPLPGPYRAYIVTDERFEAKSARNRTNKLHCMLCEADLNPTAAVFLRQVPADANTPAANLLKQLGQKVTDLKADRFSGFATFMTLEKEYQLDEARDEKAKAVKDFAAQLKAPNIPMGIVPGKSDAANLYGIKDEHELSVILFDRAKVVKRWAFTADKGPTDDDVKAIMAAVDAMTKEK